VKRSRRLAVLTVQIALHVLRALSVGDLDGARYAIAIGQVAGRQIRAEEPDQPEKA
jgi:hypothetical protein